MGAVLGLPDDLVAWVEEVGGGRLGSADRVRAALARRRGSSTCERADGTIVAVVSCATTGPIPSATKDPWTLHREATVYLALQDGPVPVPRVLGVHPVHQAMLSERVAGRELVLTDR